MQQYHADTVSISLPICSAFFVSTETAEQCFEPRSIALSFFVSFSLRYFLVLHFERSSLGYESSTKKRTSLVAPAVEQVPQLYSPLASSIASQWYSAIAECFSRRRRAIRYASLGGEYNITATIGSNITVACNNITLTRSAYHFQFDTAFVSTNAVLVKKRGQRM